MAEMCRLWRWVTTRGGPEFVAPSTQHSKILSTLRRKKKSVSRHIEGEGGDVFVRGNTAKFHISMTHFLQAMLTASICKYQTNTLRRTKISSTKNIKLTNIVICSSIILHKQGFMCLPVRHQSAAAS